MKRMTGVVAAAAVWLGSLGAPAVAAPAGLECMAAAYSVDDKANIERLSPQFGIGAGGNANDAGKTLAKLAGTASAACGEKSGWSQEEVLYASLFESGRLGEQAFRRSNMLAPTDLAKLDAALAKGNRDSLWAGIERAAMSGLTESKQENSASDTFAMGAFLLGAGIGTDDKTAEKIGVLLGLMALQRIGRREFAALHEGK